VESGTNLLAGVGCEGIRRAIQRQLARSGRGTVPKFWDGQAAGRIVEILARQVPERRLAQTHVSS
jgi:hypothetical protein